MSGETVCTYSQGITPKNGGAACGDTYGTRKRRKTGRKPLYHALRDEIQAMEVGDCLRWQQDRFNVRSVRTLLREWSYDAPRRVYRTALSNGQFIIVRVS